MKSLRELRSEQHSEVDHQRAVADRVVRDIIQPEEAIIGVLLCGSVARGDARRGPYGLYTDLTLVAENRKDVDLAALFGPDIEPHIPYHCVKVEDTGIAVELTTLKNLREIRTRWESEIFAKQEAIILYDKTGFLKEWKDTAFTISEEQKRDRALHWFFRCHYLVCGYRLDKWKHRAAWVQLCQIGNEAVECYCSFLYCINGLFIPRKDWLVYLTYELQEKIPDHEPLLETLYRTDVTEEAVMRRFQKLSEVFAWMSAYCRERQWIK